MGSASSLGMNCADVKVVTIADSRSSGLSPLRRTNRAFRPQLCSSSSYASLFPNLIADRMAGCARIGAQRGPYITEIAAASVRMGSESSFVELNHPAIEVFEQKRPVKFEFVLMSRQLRSQIHHGRLIAAVQDN
jgi:hypothetical protein